MRFAPVIVTAFLLVGCKQPTGQDRCQSLVSTMCKKIFECGAGSAFTNEADCRTKQRADIGCDAWKAPDGCTIDWSGFDQCIDDLDGLSCTDAAEGKLPAACSASSSVKVTCATDKGIRCADHRSSSSNDTCLIGRTECQDGHGYTLTCDSGACTCNVDGVATKPAFGLTDCVGYEQLLNDACGWTLFVEHETPDMTYVDLAPYPDLIPGCVISGDGTYAPGVVNPKNPCETCQPTTSSNGWTDSFEGELCGNGCGTCTSGTCERNTIVQNDSYNRDPLVRGSTLYFLGDGGKIMTVPKIGGTPAEWNGTPTIAAGLTADDTTLYWTAATTVNKAPLAGGTVTPLATSQTTPRALAVNTTHVAWISQETTIMVVPIGGGTATPLEATQNNALGIEIDDTNIYWTVPIDYTGAVRSIPIGGGTVAPVIDMIFSPYAITKDATHLYWTTDNDFGNGKLYRWSRAGGTDPVELVGNQYNAQHLAVDDTHVYWISNHVNGTAYRMAKDGTGNDDVIYDSTGEAHGLTLDDACMYWTGYGRIWSIPK